MRLTGRCRRASRGSRSSRSFLPGRRNWRNRRSRSSRDTGSGVKCLWRILGLDRQGRSDETTCFVGLNVNFELSVAGFLDFGLKIRTRRADLDMFHAKILPSVDRDRLRIRLFTLFPKHKSRTDLQLLWDNSLESQNRFLIRGLVGFYGHGFDLSASALANVKCGRDLAFFARPNLILLRLRSRTTA